MTIMECLLVASDVYQVAEVKLSYKKPNDHNDRPKIKHSRDLYNVLRSTWDEETLEYFEQFKVLMLDHTNTVLALYEVASGCTTKVLVDTKLVFTAALLANAHNIIICHNHPSGKLVPSNPDKDMTAKIKQAGDAIGIALLDHLIITTEGYLSFADEGLL